MEIIRVSRKLFDEIRNAEKPSFVAFQKLGYNPVQHERTEIKARSIYLIDTGSNLRDASCRIMLKK